jgi:hypothetical protein
VERGYTTWCGFSRTKDLNRQHTDKYNWPRFSLGFRLDTVGLFLPGHADFSGQGLKGGQGVKDNLLVYAVRDAEIPWRSEAAAGHK